MQAFCPAALMQPGSYRFGVPADVLLQGHLVAVLHMYNQSQLDHVSLACMCSQSQYTAQFPCAVPVLCIQACARRVSTQHTYPLVLCMCMHTQPSLSCTCMMHAAGAARASTKWQMLSCVCRVPARCLSAGTVCVRTFPSPALQAQTWATSRAAGGALC
jgi:hypothetical protein